jgi:arylsulfatase A
MANPFRRVGETRAAWAALGTMLFALLACCPALAADEKPNVVLIFIDDLGWADLGCYGSRFYRTPNIDHLASEGMRFTQAYAACPVCSPTRAALLTGKYPARLHLTDFIPGELHPRKDKFLRPESLQQLPLEEITLPERLKALGYTTAAIGKWHLGGAGFEPQQSGFDMALGGFERGSVASHFAPYLPAGRQLPGVENPPEGEYVTDRLTSEAERFLEANAARPFFLYLSHYAVHTPIQAKREVVAKYESGPKPKSLQRNPVFAAMVESMDDSAGRILAKLDALKLADKTLVIFTSDNGGLATSGQPTPLPATNNAPLREGKGYLYEGGIRVPLVARWPGRIKPGTTCRVPTSTIDLPPTIAAVCGAKFENPIDGVSILPLLEGAPALDRDALYWHYPHYSPQGGKPGGAIREGDLKLVEFYETGRRELFDLSKDISESFNLVDRESSSAERLAAKLAAWRSSVGADMPRPNPQFVPDTQEADGTIALPAETADVHGVMIRYEPLPHKDTIGFWVRADDWVSWDFVVNDPGTFAVELLSGCGAGSGGSQIEITADGQSLTTNVEETGGFQNFVPRAVGNLTISRPGKHTLSVKARTKPKAAVMDLRRVRLLPQAKD